MSTTLGKVFLTTLLFLATQAFWVLDFVLLDYIRYFLMGYATLTHPTIKYGLTLRAIAFRVLVVLEW